MAREKQLSKIKMPEKTMAEQEAEMDLAMLDEMPEEPEMPEEMDEMPEEVGMMEGMSDLELIDELEKRGLLSGKELEKLKKGLPEAEMEEEEEMPEEEEELDMMAEDEDDELA